MWIACWWSACHIFLGKWQPAQAGKLNGSHFTVASFSRFYISYRNSSGCKVKHLQLADHLLKWCFPEMIELLAYDQVSNLSILKWWTNIYHDNNENGENLFRPGRTSKPLMNLSQDCWCCGQGGTMPPTSYSKTTNGLYACLTTSEQLVDLGYPLSPIPRGKPQALKKALAVAQHGERISRSSEPGISPWFLVAMANSARCPTGIWS